MKQLIFFAALVYSSAALADPANIVDVSTGENGGTWRFDVTLAHPDTGWDHYADGWRVLSMEGAELGMRVLFHPHVDEQPFTRSLSGVIIPSGATQVQIQARCQVDGWGDQLKTVDLP